MSRADNLPSDSQQPLAILRVFSKVSQTACSYNEHSSTDSSKFRTTLCTYRPPQITIPTETQLFAGDGTIRGFFFALRGAARQSNFDIIHVYGPGIAFLFLLAKIRHPKLLSPAVMTIDNSYQSFSLRNKLLLLPAFGLFRRVICCGQASLESFPRFYRWLAGQRACAVPNGVNLHRVDQNLANQHGVDQHRDFTIASVGRLIPIKNPLTVLRAFQKAAESTSRLRYIGEGTLRDDLLVAREAAGMENQIEFTGLIPRESVYEVLDQADLFVSASYGEGLPVAAMEAMACRCPVILSDIPPHQEIAAGADFIPLVPPHDTEAFTREIDRIRRMTRDQRNELGRACRQHVQQRFSLAEMHRGYDHVYDQVLRAA